MSSSALEINNQVRAGRKTIDRSMREIHKRLEAADMSRMRIVAAGVMVAAIAVGVGLMVYRRRRRHTLAERLQHALLELMRRPAALRAQLERPIERAVWAV